MTPLVLADSKILRSVWDDQKTGTLAGFCNVRMQEETMRLVCLHDMLAPELGIGLVYFEQARHASYSVRARALAGR